MAQPAGKRVRALTLRIPAGDYDLLRALAFAREKSINELVMESIRVLWAKPGAREKAETLIKQAQAMRRVRGASTALPTNPAGRGRRRK